MTVAVVVTVRVVLESVAVGSSHRWARVAMAEEGAMEEEVRLRAGRARR